MEKQDKILKKSLSDSAVSPVSSDSPVSDLLNAIINEPYDESTGDWKTGEMEKTEEISSYPTFSDKLQDPLPQLLQDAASQGNGKADTDLLILGSIVALSVGMTNTYGHYYQNKVHPNLFLFVVAPAASGKSRLKLCQNLVNPIHQQLREEDAANMEVYEEKKETDYQDRIPRPPIRTLIIPANSSATAMYQILNDNHGVGLIYDTEGDTLANTLKSDYGDFSEGLRKAFHHEPISYARRKDREFVEVNNPKLSAVLSGTPEQVHSLIPNEENGLFSRFIYYNLNLDLRWKNVFAHNDVTHDEFFQQLGSQFYEFYNQYLGEKNILIILTREQEYKFNKFFANLTVMYYKLQGNDFTSATRRLGLIAFRIMMVLSTLRMMDTGDVTDVQICDPCDFRNALVIVSVLVQHSAIIFQSFPSSGQKPLAEGTLQKHDFFAQLPQEFNRSKYLAVAAELNIPAKTAENHIATFCKKGRIVRIKQGFYQKQ